MRIERGLDLAQQRDGDRIAEAGQLVALELADAVFGGNRSAPFGHEVMDLRADRLAIGDLPGGGFYTGRCNDMEVDVAIA